MQLHAQPAVELPAFHASTQAAETNFRFVSDGPPGPGWTRPNEIARTYFHQSLPTFFTRTIELDGPLPMYGSLDWIFTGPRAGFTVSLSANSVRVVQRYYDSTGLGGGGGFPSRETQEDSRAFFGSARSLAVVMDSHLSVSVLINGVALLTQRCVFDVTRHQLMWRAPRSRHEIVAGRLLHETALPVTLEVLPGKTHQAIKGFGGSPSIPAYAGLSEKGQQMYWDILRRYNLLIEREYPMGSELRRDLSNLDNLADATPHYYGDNFPNGEVSDFAYSRHTLELGGSVLYEMWALPKWATVDWQPAAGAPPILDAWDKPVTNAADPESYAHLVVAYCRMLEGRSGAAPAIVGIQNEVEQPAEVYARMTTVLRRELDRAGFAATRIQLADAPFVSMEINRAKALQQHPEAWKATDFVASHQYDFQQFLADPDLYDDRLRALHEAGQDKPFLATEICLNDAKAQEPSFRLAFQVGQLYHKDLTLLDAEMLLYCWLILDIEQPTFGSSRALLVPDRTHGDIPVASSFQLRVLGAWSRHLQRGMRRVEVASPDKDVLATAFTGSSRTTLVVMNRSTAARELDIKWPGTPAWKQAEHTSVYFENQSSPYTFGSPLIVAPGEILTLTTETAP